MVLLLCTLHSRYSASLPKESEIYATKHTHYSVGPIGDAEVSVTEAVSSFRGGLDPIEKKTVMVLEAKNKTGKAKKPAKRRKKKKERIRVLKPLNFTRNGEDKRHVKLFASYP